MTPDSNTCYRAILNAELGKRQDKNHSYSLRAFARDIEVSPSRLSEILNDSKNMSPQTAVKVAKKLNFGDVEQQYFIDLVLLNSKNDLKRQLAQIRVNEYLESKKFSQLDLETFSLISKWHYLCLLELCEVNGFKSDPKWISEKMGISEKGVLEALARLEKLGLIQIEEEEIKRLHSKTIVEPKVKTESIRKYHVQMLELAKNSVTEQDLTERNLTSSILAFDRQNLAKAQKLINTFHHNFCKEVGDISECSPDSVYNISIQFFKLAEN